MRFISLLYHFVIEYQIRFPIVLGRPMSDKSTAAAAKTSFCCSKTQKIWNGAAQKIPLLQLKQRKIASCSKLLKMQDKLNNFILVLSNLNIFSLYACHQLCLSPAITPALLLYLSNHTHCMNTNTINITIQSDCRLIINISS